MTTMTGRPSVVFEPAGADGIARLVIDRPDDTVNAVNQQVVDDLAQAVRAARAAAPRGLIVVSAKANQWVAGADLNIVTQAADPSQVEAVSRRYQGALDELAWLPCTTVAAINGAALGGGLELALACDYRLAADAPSVVLGQPEVNLGLVPAGGGTQRLPRLIGLRAALDLILTGHRLNARRARRAGLLDEVVHPTVLDRAARRWAARPKRPLDRPIAVAGFGPHLVLDLAEQTWPGRQAIYRQARQAVLARTHGHYPAPLKALDAVQVGFEHGLAAGLAAEAHAFGEVAGTDIARNLVWLFMATQHNKRLARTQSRVAHMGVVGAGFMGAAIAEVGAAAGVSVRVKDVSPEAVARGLATIRRLVDEGRARRRFDAFQARDVLQRVSGAADYAGLATADVVIEAVFEDLAVKRDVVHDLESVLRPDAVIASNTSAIPIKDIAQNASHPERIVGMHFFSPAQRMPLLEVVRPVAASNEAVDRAVALGVKLGKTVIVVGDAPGFFTTRVLGVMLNEAALLLGEGARLEDVDRAMTDFGFPVGPFVVYDEVGLEVAQHVGDTVAAAYGERFPGVSIVAELVAAGNTGRKTGAGFYLWPKPSGLPRAVRGILPRPGRAANPLVYRVVGKRPVSSLSATDIQERLVLLFVNEAIRCLDEGVLQSAADGDLGCVLGLGFPPFRGGPFHYADSIGLQTLADRLTALASRHGNRYQPAPSLLERAHEGRAFYPEGGFDTQ